MTTSYFAKYKGTKGVSIAGGTPGWFKCRQYKKLAPKYWFFKEYKEGRLSEEEYTTHYLSEVLGKLDPVEVYKELGEDAVMLCWEAKGKFCHRHIVAKWLNEKLNLNITEL